MTAARTLDHLMRSERGRLLAALVARVGDFSRAEEALQEAAASAHVHWGRVGVPANPVAWLLRVGLRKAIDGYRREGALARHRAVVEELAAEEAALPETEPIADERLRLIFTCCHPALEPKTRVALTLRSLCGLTTAQVAAVYLDAEPTMGQRLSRARAKISAAGIPFEVPGSEAWADRLNSVLTVIYLVFTAGYTAEATIGRDLCEEAIYLARMVNTLRPEEPEVEGCLALLQLTHARSAARVDEAGATVPPAHQDRALWDHVALGEGRSLLDRAMARRRPGPFQIKAAIAACQSRIEGPDWPQIAALYQGLLRHEDTSVTRLNLAVAFSETGQVARAQDLIASISNELDGFQPYHAARADILARLGRHDESRAAYDRAIQLCDRRADVSLLIKRRAALPVA